MWQARSVSRNFMVSLETKIQTERNFCIHPDAPNVEVDDIPIPKISSHIMHSCKKAPIY